MSDNIIKSSSNMLVVGCWFMLVGLSWNIIKAHYWIYFGKGFFSLIQGMTNMLSLFKNLLLVQN